MPVESFRDENGIFHHRWYDDVVLDDVAKAIRGANKTAEEFGDVKRASIIDLRDCNNIPFDISNLLRLVQEDTAIGYVIIQPSKVVKFIRNVLVKIITTPLIIVDTPEEALKAVQEILRTPEKYVPQKE